MNKCLVTKLNTSVSSDLKKFGDCVIYFGYVSSVMSITNSMFSFIKETKVRLRNGYFTDSTGVENYGSETTVPTGSYTLYINSDGTKEVEFIFDKYSLSKIEDNGLVLGVKQTTTDLSELRYSYNLNYIRISNIKFKGSVDDNIKYFGEPFRHLLFFGNNYSVTASIRHLSSLKVKELGFGNLKIIGSDIVDEYIIPRIEDGDYERMSIYCEKRYYTRGTLPNDNFVICQVPSIFVHIS